MKHPSLILVVGLGAVILIVAVISVVMLCFCVSRQGKHIEPFKETGMQRVAWNYIFICSFISFNVIDQLYSVYNVVFYIAQLAYP